MIQFAISKSFKVRNTTFPHKDFLKETWYSADGGTVNQIEHVLISDRFKGAITYIIPLRGPDTGSNHNLLKINFKMKLRVKTKKKYIITNKSSEYFSEFKMETRIYYRT
jgi:hypothetical protein